MPTCSFCRRIFKEPRGLTVYCFDGRALHYCSSKCRKNAGLGRDSKKLKWVCKKNAETEIATDKNLNQEGQ